MNDEIKPILTPEEEQKMVDGQAIYEMTKTRGFGVFRKMLETMAYHSWVDPRGTKVKDEWVWQELNAFHASNNAKEILLWINDMTSEAEFLHKKKTGEIPPNQRMRIGSR